ncbi:CdaR family protein [Leuconostocaceae bacterium ESL0958]|nr:CdaR family protein [Leuconostocaceae bacterium ESL0958]
MNKLKKVTSSKAVNLLFSLVLALLVAAYVLSTKPSITRTSDNNNSSSSFIPEKRATLTVPLTLQYNTDDYVISGAPASVNVSVHGSAALVAAAQNHNDVQASVDLRGLRPGQHTVTVALSGVNSSLTATTVPQTVTVTIAQKATAKKNIKVLYDDQRLASGYTVKDTTTDPQSVTISGTKEAVDSVSYVGASLDLDKNTKSNMTRQAKLAAYDQNGEPVDVTLSKTEAKVTAQVASGLESKQVSLQPAAANDQSDLSAYNITLSQNNVTVKGSSDTLKNIDTLEVPLDLSNVKKQTQQTVTLTKPNGVAGLSDNQVTATISPKQSGQ